MINKYIICFITLLLLLSIAACGQAESTDEFDQSVDEAIEVTGDMLPAFSTVDLHGNSVTNDIFKDKQVTMVNFWGTWCPPCVRELPDLGELARTLPEGTQIIGICEDAGDDNETLRLAIEILSRANAEYLNIIPDEALRAYMENLVGFPTTIFVDENGVLLGKPIVGARGLEEFRAALESHMR